MKRILSLILCLSVLLSASVFSLVASADDVANEEPAWTEYVPTEITDAIEISAIKGFEWMGYSDDTSFKNLTRSLDNSAFLPLASTKDIGTDSWSGAIVLSSDELTGPIAGKEADELNLRYVQLNAGAGNSVMLYVEIPDYEKSGATWALALTGLSYLQNGTVIHSNIDWDGIKFHYLALDGEAWVESDLLSQVNSGSGYAQLTLPTGFKGYIRLSPQYIPQWGTLDLTQAYTFNSINFALNSAGGECGDFVFGGVTYITNNISDSTYMTYKGSYFKLNKYENSTILAKSYAGYNESNSSNSTTDITLTGGNSAAVWDLGSAIFTSATGTAQTAQAKYTRDWSNIAMQPGVDTFMMYVEVPEFTGTACPLQLDQPEIRQSKGNGEYRNAYLYPRNVTYWYMSVKDGVWKKARTGLEGELNDIPSGFKGYIKFDIKSFNFGPWNNYSDAINNGFDFSKPYNIEQFRLYYNYAGGEDNPFVFGSLYSVFSDADSYIFANSVVGTQTCAKEITGDLTGDGVVDATDLANARKVLLGLAGFDAFKANRAALNTDDSEFNIRDLVALKKLVSTL